MEAAISSWPGRKEVYPQWRERAERKGESDATADTGKLLANPYNEVRARPRLEMFAFYSLPVKKNWVTKFKK
jgi:hypothetical protein